MDNYLEKLEQKVDKLSSTVEEMNIRLTVMETQINMLHKAIYLVPIGISIFTFIANYLDAVMHI